MIYRIPHLNTMPYMKEAIVESERGQDERANVLRQKEDQSRTNYIQLCTGIRELLSKQDIPLHAGASGTDMVAVLQQASGSTEALHSGEHLSDSWTDEYNRLMQGVGVIARTSFTEDSDPETILSGLRESVG